MWLGAFPTLKRDGHKYGRGHAVVVSGPAAQTGAGLLNVLAQSFVGLNPIGRNVILAQHMLSDAILLWHVGVVLNVQRPLAFEVFELAVFLRLAQFGFNQLVKVHFV